MGRDHAIEEGLQQQAHTAPRVTQTRRRPAAVARDDVESNSTPNAEVTFAPRAIKIRPIQATTSSGPLTL